MNKEEENISDILNKIEHIKGDLDDLRILTVESFRELDKQHKSQLEQKLTELDFLYDLRDFVKHNSNYDVQKFLIEKLLGGK